MALCADQYANEAELLKALEFVRAEIADLDKVAPQIWAEEQAIQQKAIDAFEAEITMLQSMGAGDRANTIAWICQAHRLANDDSQMGWEHLEYNLGIPYGYIKKSLV
jgi:hypothetical protein